MKKIIENLEITDFAAEGKSMGKKDGKVYFAPHTVPGDLVDLRLTRKRSSYAEGRVTEYKKLSAERTDPFCRHFGLCGGCQWQMVSYEKQLAFKQDQVGDSLQRIGGIDIRGMEPIIGSPLNREYRNKMEFSFSDGRWLDQEEIDSGRKLERNGLGFHIPGRYDKVLDLHQCYLQGDVSNDIRNWVKKFALDSGLAFYNVHEHQGFWRTLMLRNNHQNDWLVHFQIGYEEKEVLEVLKEKMPTAFPGIKSITYSVNPKKNDSIYDLEIVPLFGEPHIIESLFGIQFKIGPKAFFQTNLEQTKNLYQKVLEFAQLNGDELVWDLYSGVGSISLFIAQKARKVIGIETVRMAVDNARENAFLNKIDNAEFIAGDVKDILEGNHPELMEKPDLVILDPPREGLHKKVAEALLELRPSRIVYVSCKPSTQARDLQILSEVYEVLRIQPVDMFPQTHHTECVVLLVLRN